MKTKQLIKEVNEGCILAKIERKEIIELLEEGEENKKYKKMWDDFSEKHDEWVMYEQTDYPEYAKKLWVDEYMSVFKNEYFLKEEK